MEVYYPGIEDKTSLANYSKAYAYQSQQQLQNACIFREDPLSQQRIDSQHFTELLISPPRGGQGLVRHGKFESFFLYNVSPDDVEKFVAGTGISPLDKDFKSEAYTIEQMKDAYPTSKELNLAIYQAIQKHHANYVAYYKDKQSLLSTNDHKELFICLREELYGDEATIPMKMRVIKRSAAIPIEDVLAELKINPSESKLR